MKLFGLFLNLQPAPSMPVELIGLSTFLKIFLQLIQLFRRRPFVSLPKMQSSGQAKLLE
jgi:hypothetical protein